MDPLLNSIIQIWHAITGMVYENLSLNFGMYDMFGAVSLYG